MLIVAGMAIGAVAMRPKCATPVISTTTVAPRAVEVTSVPEPVAIASFATPAASAPGRNVFAYRAVEDRRPRLSVSEERQAGAPVPHPDDAPPTIVVRPPDPPPAYNYLGSFGPQSMPILVYKGNGEIVNVPLRKP